MNVASLFTSSLRNCGVKHIYGLIGTSIIDLIDSLIGSGIRYISTRHEQGAVCMADGEARVTGNLGVAFVHGGPGFLNSLTGIANAYKDSSKLAVIAGAVKRRLAGLDSWLEVNQCDIVRSIVKGTFRIERGNEANPKLSEALSLASSKPYGPVFLEVPEDVWRVDAGDNLAKINVLDLPFFDDREINKVIGMLKASKRPVILIGGGLNSFDGCIEMEKLLSKVKVPVVSTGNGRGVVPENNELCYGRVGFGGGNIAADTILKESDLVLAVGCGLSDVTTYGFNQIPTGEIVVIDLDKKWSLKPIQYSLHIECDAVEFVRKLAQKIDGYYADKDWLAFCESLRERLERQIREYTKIEKSGYVNPGLFLSQLDEKLPSDYILSVGQGFHTLYAYSFMKVRYPNSFLAATNMGSMGFALPAALGAKLSKAEREVISIIGDGEFMMSLGELETAVRERIGSKIVIMNDSSYRVLLMRQRIQKMGRIFGTMHGNPDIVKIASAFGIEAIRVNSNQDIQSAIEFLMKKSEKPMIVELIVDKDDVPPFNFQASLMF